MRPGIDSAAKALEASQRKHEARLDWLRSLKTGDVVTLTWQDYEHVAGGPKKEMVAVHRSADGIALYVDGHPRRDVRTGKWERGGKAWLWLRIDPVEAP